MGVVPAFENSVSRPSLPPPGPPTMMPGRERVVPRRQDRMRLRVRPLPLELLERSDDLQQLLDRVHAAAAATASVDREVPRRRVRLDTVDLDPEVHETALGGAEPELGRLERDGHVGRRDALDDLTRAVSDHLLVGDDVEEDVAARAEPLLEHRLDGPQRRREPALHVGRSPTVEPPVDEGAREGLLRPRARVADRHDVDVRVEGERAAAAGPGPPRDEQRMGGEGRGRADVPAVELEAESAPGIRRRSRCSGGPRPGSASPRVPGSRS